MSGVLIYHLSKKKRKKPKHKSVTGWGIMTEEGLMLWAAKDRATAKEECLKNEKVVRVRISIVRDRRRKAYVSCI